ncbi:ATP-grasp domain-containing protein [Bacillus sp. EB600]|uniref:ATP-grasp domain-containing protein n=1 Tax=Bacillus sp. EB600 TaxID=2806345 RepID=UPI002109D54E|nr:ATP-grasp domain-containing protein [Bacillus sp. EB600]MCQ6278892.1 ATP-grasp domain-containing protein [Bacillus sp. EB600]
MKEYDINILFTSSGRRVSLIKKFRETYLEKNLKGRIITADLKHNAPSAFYSNKHYLVPRVTDDNYLAELLNICEIEEIDLVIPLIDTELVLLANNKDLFEQIGVKLLISSKKLNEIANDKLETYKFFSKNGIATPKVFSEEDLTIENFKFPLLIKPRHGSSSKGVIKINNKRELDFFKDYIPNPIIQEFIMGIEYTVDVMTDFNGNIKTIVPRQRIETRAGEVSKGITKKDIEIINAVESVVTKLPGAAGCITLQCFKKEDGTITFIEINPRFGGGIPLSIEAGANFPLWTIELCLGATFNKYELDWKENLIMLRFDDAVFSESIGYEDKSVNI